MSRSSLHAVFFRSFARSGVTQTPRPGDVEIRCADALDQEARRHGATVGPERHIGVEHRDERVEVTVAGGGQPG
jgi:hypothetical protein